MVLVRCVLPTFGLVHVFAVTTTLWGFTTLPPTPGVIPVGYATLVVVYLGVAFAVCGSCAGWPGQDSSHRPRTIRNPRAPRSRPADQMHLYALPMIFALIGLTMYVVLGGADFGAGIWQLTAGTGEDAARVRDHAHDSMAPVREANHVWLIFVLTVTWTAYPTAFGSVASTLSVPCSQARSRPRGMM